MSTQPPAPEPEHSPGFGDRSMEDDAAVARVFPLVYDELRRLAHRHLRHEPTGHTLSTTDLVHQAYVQLSGSGGPEFSDRAHFMALAAVAMRRILIDHARSHATQKRGGGLAPVPLESIQLATEERAEMLLALDEALERLQHLDPRQARVVECRFFGGLSLDETAAALDLSVRTVMRDWTRAKSWLHGELYPERTPPPTGT